jgi:hypothetical protein
VRAVCCDALNSGARPTSLRLRHLGVTGVRLVARNHPDFYSYCKTLNGLEIAVVLARESFEDENYTAMSTMYANAIRPALWLVGNEPNSTGDASWTMTNGEHEYMFNRCRAGIRQVDGTTPVYIGGMLGDPTWLRIEKYDKPNGIDVHYPDTEAQLAAYTKYGLDLSVMEWCWAGRRVRQSDVTDWQKMLNQYTKHSAWYCWSDAQGSPGMGLVSSGGHFKKAYYQYKNALRQ